MAVAGVQVRVRVRGHTRLGSDGVRPRVWVSI